MNPADPQETPTAASSDLPPLPPGGKPLGKPGLDNERVFPAGKVLGLGLAAGLVLVVVTMLLSWQRPVERPDLSDLRAIETVEADEDVEQGAFRQAEVAPLPLPKDSESGLDYPWVARLRGEWSLDLNRGAVTLGFSDEPVRPPLERLGPMDHFAVKSRVDLDHLGIGGADASYYTVLKPAEGGSFLLLRDSRGKTLEMLDDLQAHGSDLISYRPRGTSERRYGHRLRGPMEGLLRSLAAQQQEIERQTEDPRQTDDRPLIQVTRLSSSELWQKAEAFKRAGRYDSLERLLRRIPESDPKARRARQWRKRLSRWKKDQKGRMTRTLKSHLEQLQLSVASGNPGAALPLFIGGARSPTHEFLSGFFARGDRHKARYLLKDLSLRDGVLIFDVTFTLESHSGSTLSIETHPWHARLHDDRFLDPFPG